jgi:hypothetical protein
LQNYAIRCQWSYEELGKKYCEGMLPASSVIVNAGDSEPLLYLQMRNKVLAYDLKPDSAQNILAEIGNLKSIRGNGSDLTTAMDALQRRLECARGFENGIVVDNDESLPEEQITVDMLRLPNLELGEHEKVQQLLSAVRQSPTLGSQVAIFQSMNAGVISYKTLSTFIRTVDGFMTSSTAMASKPHAVLAINVPTKKNSAKWCDFHRSDSHWSRDFRASLADRVDESRSRAKAEPKQVAKSEPSVMQTKYRWIVLNVVGRIWH